VTESPPDRTELEALWGDVARRSSGYLRRELPNPLDGVLGNVVERFSDGNEATREAIIETMTLDAARALAVYGERMASLAVHEDSTATLLRGLVAVGMAAAREYHKELIVLLPLFDRSARKLTIDPDALFDAAAEILAEAAPEWLSRFPERSEAERDLARMRYEERLSNNGLLYARSGPMMSREEVEELQRRLEG
jgi:hypothetical protein